ncbi:LysM peptidoglycan-binding domain-containing protein [Ornithinimicrobium cerasi]|uniref:Transcriptional activator domain-containing protein n=1 Tax=Ornithinimicrobium cerasi TaxID=2248773 RepID=A0A285VU77_9MICO|nr:hypothetical protein [Ornithinimicrobium cerasi]SOC57513.1 hypothetical protein SAMN05421879_11344 [Ornithinimicrobium cerasi]SOC57581.1 hypothetical protein SAMN05421879_11423 [Ornithinimicrobium cerasi]
MSTTAPHRPTPGYRPRSAADHLPRPAGEGRSVGRGLLATLGLLLLVVGVPAALVSLVGNPLPSSLPDRSWLTAPITADALISIFAVLVWVVWAHFVLCLVAEVRAARAGRMPGLVPAGGGSQLLARRLVAGVLLLAGSATMTGHAPGQEGVPVAAVVSTDAGAAAHSGGPALANGSDAGPVARAADGVEALTAGAAAAATAERQQPTVTKFYEVNPPSGRHHDTLWDIADRTLGDPFRYKEIFELNKDRVQPDGRRLIDADLIQPGWQLVMPADATGPDIASVRTHTPLTRSTTEVATDALAGGGRVGAAEAGAARTDGVRAGHLQGGAVVDGAGTAEASDAASRDVAPPTGSSVDLGELALGGGMVLAGLALALGSRRGPYGTPGAEEQALRLAGDPGRADLLDRALRHLAAGRRQQALPLPDAAVVYLDDDQVIVHLAVADDPGLPPAPWRTTEGGRVWSVSSGDLVGQQPTGGAPWPGLVALARTHGYEVLVDLEHAPGLVSVGGSAEVAREVVLSMVVDLVTHPWSDSVDVTLVGFAGQEALAELAPGRVRTVVSIDEALAGARRDAERRTALLRGLGVDGVLAGRLAGSGRELRPHVLVLSGDPSPEQAQQLTDLTGGGRSGLAAVCVGQSLAARWRFGVDQGGTLDLGVLGVSGTARRLRHEDLALVAGWVRSAAADAAEATSAAAALDPAGALRTLPDEGRGLAAAAQPMAAPGTARASVGLLGPVLVSAQGTLNPAREQLLTELVTLVALHPEGVHDAVLRVSLWPRGVEDDVVTATLAAAVQWLGTDADGTPLLDNRAGRWQLSPQVHVDWLELVAVAGDAADDRHRVTDLLTRARGEAFSGTPVGRYTWLAFHQAARDARVLVTAVARRAAAAHASAQDAPLAERTLRSALQLVPRSQALWRDLVRLTGGGDPGAAGAVVAELHRALGHDRDGLEPETVALVEHLLPDGRELG